MFHITKYHSGGNRRCYVSSSEATTNIKVILTTEVAVVHLLVAVVESLCHHNEAAEILLRVATIIEDIKRTLSTDIFLSIIK